jgi:hypothetical protein
MVRAVKRLAGKESDAGEEGSFHQDDDGCHEGEAQSAALEDGKGEDQGKHKNKGWPYSTAAAPLTPTAPTLRNVIALFEDSLPSKGLPDNLETVEDHELNSELITASQPDSTSMAHASRTRTQSEWPFVACKRQCTQLHKPSV